MTILEEAKRSDYKRKENLYISDLKKVHPLLNKYYAKEFQDKVIIEQIIITPEQILNHRIERGIYYKSLRKQSRLSKADLCYLSGLHRATIDRIENGNHAYNIDGALIYTQTIKNYMSKTI